MKGNRGVADRRGCPSLRPPKDIKKKDDVNIVWERRGVSCPHWKDLRLKSRQTSELLDSTLDRCTEAIWRSDYSSDGTTHKQPGHLGEGKELLESD